MLLWFKVHRHVGTKGANVMVARLTAVSGCLHGCVGKMKAFYFQAPEERLGCHPQTGFADIQSHPFFRSIDWELLERRQITPPYKPSVLNDRDLEHFDPQFTSEPVQLTPDDG